MPTAVDDLEESCYCDEDQGCGYTYSDEYGPCKVCLGPEEEEDE